MEKCKIIESSFEQYDPSHCTTHNQHPSYCKVMNEAFAEGRKAERMEIFGDNKIPGLKGSGLKGSLSKAILNDLKDKWKAEGFKEGQKSQAEISSQDVLMEYREGKRGIKEAQKALLARIETIIDEWQREGMHHDAPVKKLKNKLKQSLKNMEK